MTLTLRLYQKEVFLLTTHCTLTDDVKCWVHHCEEFCTEPLVIPLLIFWSKFSLKKKESLPGFFLFFSESALIGSQRLVYDVIVHYISQSGLLIWAARHCFSLICWRQVMIDGVLNILHYVWPSWILLVLVHKAADDILPHKVHWLFLTLDKKDQAIFQKCK